LNDGCRSALPIRSTMSSACYCQDDADQGGCPDQCAGGEPRQAQYCCMVKEIQQGQQAQQVNQNDVFQHSRPFENPIKRQRGQKQERTVDRSESRMRRR